MYKFYTPMFIYDQVKMQRDINFEGTDQLGPCSERELVKDYRKIHSSYSNNWIRLRLVCTEKLS